MIGGGDTALEEALYLSNLCKSVTIFVRKNKLRASQIMKDRLFKKTNISVSYNVDVLEILGDRNVKSIRVKNNQTSENFIRDVDGVFIAIGHKPNSDLFNGFIDLDIDGYVQTKNNSSKTNVEGVFACGDLQDKHYRQAVTAAGSGCIAALDAERYLSEKYDY